MADKSTYMAAGGYASGYIGTNATMQGYAREDYVSGLSTSTPTGGGSGQQPGVKARNDVSAYMPASGGSGGGAGGAGGGGGASDTSCYLAPH